SGELWRANQRFDAAGGQLAPDGVNWSHVWLRAPTLELNPTFDKAEVERAMEEDPESAKAEYLGEFRQDVESLFSWEAVNACVDKGVIERPPSGSVSYDAFVDASGGSHDSFCCAVAHTEGARRVLDMVHEVRAPFAPEVAVDEVVSRLRPYRVGAVTGDRYSGEWVSDAFRRRGLTYRVSDRSKSEIYAETLPLVNSRQVALLDVPRLTAQAVGLERHVARGSGRPVIDHAPNGHDDLVNAAAGALTLELPMRESGVRVADWSGRPVSGTFRGCQYRGGLPWEGVDFDVERDAKGRPLHPPIRYHEGRPVRLTEADWASVKEGGAGHPPERKRGGVTWG
ncbi:MAG TPA: hypothetical protein VMI11_07520, partial [Actinomycetes bacterium]|nr:hypothetical protein [Actinomycetes bacterium]